MFFAGQYELGVDPIPENSSGEHFIYVGTVIAQIQLVDGEPVSAQITRQIKGRVSFSEALKILNGGSLSSNTGEGIEYPMVSKEVVYPRKERARKPGRKKKS